MITLKAIQAQKLLDGFKNFSRQFAEKTGWRAMETSEGAMFWFPWL